jgi:hypothetical protein
MQPKKKKRLGELMVDAGFIDKLQLRAALAQQEQWGKPLGRTLVEMRLVTEEQLIRVLSEQLNLPTIDVSTVRPSPDALVFLDEAFCRRHECLPFAYNEKHHFLDIAVSDIQDQGLYDTLRVRTRCNIRVYLAGPDAIRDAVERAFGQNLSDMELQFQLSENLFDFGVEEDLDPRHVDPAVRPPTGTHGAVHPTAAMAGPTPTGPFPAPPSPTGPFPATPGIPQQPPWHAAAAFGAPPAQPTGGPLPVQGPGAFPAMTYPQSAAPMGMAALSGVSPSLASPELELRQHVLEARLASALAKIERQDALLQQLVMHLRGVVAQLAQVNLIDLPPNHPLLPQPAVAPPAAAPTTPTPIPPLQALASAAPGLRPEPVLRPIDREPLLRPIPEPEPLLRPIPGPVLRPVDPPAAPQRRRTSDPAAPVVRQQRDAGATGGTPHPSSPSSRGEPELISLDGGEERHGGLVTAPQRPSAAEVRPSPARAVAGAEPMLPMLELPAGTQTAVAMDLGTTRSSVAAVVDGRVSVLKLPGGDWDIPSVVGFRSDGSVVLGKVARRMLSDDSANAIASPKRLLGRRFDEPGLRPYLAQLGMKSTGDARNDIVLHSHQRTVAITEVCAHLLNLLRLVAERNLGRAVREVILTVPATSGERQLRALSAAAAKAELHVLEFLHEPVAAAMACIFDEACEGRIAVYDFGGGTFDFSIVEIGGDTMQVIGTSGDSWLGGDDFDAALAAAAANACWQQHKVELRNQAHHWQALLLAAETAKRALSEREEAVVRLPGAIRRPDGEAPFEYPVTRRQFAELTRGIVERSLESCQEALAMTKMRPQDLNAVFLSGGTSYIPSVQGAVADFFGKQPRVVIPPERMVVVGAAAHGALIPPGAG